MLFRSDAERVVVATLPETPDEPLLPVAAADKVVAGTSTPATAEKAADQPDGAGLTFDDPTMDWTREEDPFANLGPIDPEGTDDPKPRGSGSPGRRR